MSESDAPTNRGGRRKRKSRTHFNDQGQVVLGDDVMPDLSAVADAPPPPPPPAVEATAEVADAATVEDPPQIAEAPPVEVPPAPEDLPEVAESPEVEEQPEIAEAAAVEQAPEVGDTPEAGSVLSMTGPSGVDGLPAAYDDGVAWLRNGFLRMKTGTLVGLVVGWTGVWIALWGAAVGLVAGALVATGLAQKFGQGAGVGQATGVLGAIGGGLLGALYGFLAVLRFIVDRPLQLVLSIISGAILAVILVVVIAAFERLGLRLRGYRRLSRREVRRVAPLVKDVADAMQLAALPRFAMAESLAPNAWTHMRTVVLTAGLLQSLSDPELRAILAHELEHWRAGDAVAKRFVWAAAWPVIVNYNIGMALAGGTKEGSEGKSRSGPVRGLMWLVGWTIAWPMAVIIRFVITPVVAGTQRKFEYSADAAVARIGYAADLSSALPKLTAYDTAGRTGWEQAMKATHPPVELRLEALAPAQADDFEYQEEELRAPSGKELARLATFWRRNVR